MPSVDTNDPRLDQTRFWVVYSKLAQIQLGTLCNAYDYHSIKRLIEVEGDDVSAHTDDPLAERIVAGIKALPSKVRVGSETMIIDPPASLAALFQVHPLARSLKPKLFVGFDLQDANATVCGMLSACTFERDEALSTGRLTQAYCTTHQLPRLDANWMFVDVVASSKPGTGALLLLGAIVAAARAKKTGVCSIAVTRDGRRLFSAFGFSTDHGWREGKAQRNLCHIRLKDVHLGELHARLRVHDALLADVCFRNGLTAQSAPNLIKRC